MKGQTTSVLERNLNTPQQTETKFANSYYIEDLSQSAEKGKIRLTEGLENEVEKVENILTSTAKDKKGTIVIDKFGGKRLAVIDNLALRLLNGNVSKELRGKRLLKINLAQIALSAKNEAEINTRLETAFVPIEKIKDQVIVIVEEISSFSQNNPLFGVQISAKLRNTLANGKIQVISTGTIEDYNKEILADNLLKKRFGKIDLNEENSEDSFVGDKLSPDLRELVNNSDPSQKVKVILQSDDIGNPQLRGILQKNGISIESEAKNLNMLVIDLPVRAAEEIASLRGAKHLSLDRELKTFGHIKTTTGTSLVHTIQQGLNVGLLGTTVVNSSTLLDGTGIGIAVVDSGIRDDHRSFVNANGSSRITAKVDFTNDNNLSEDRYGHGTHFASLATGSGGQNLNIADGLYLDNYEGIAPNAKVLNIQVLNENGLGSSSRLISVLDWIYTNRTQYNIRIVNLSLGSPAIESWRNDPLCRAVRKLTAAGIVVVAAAGNNGKTAGGQKIYGAIHSPGNDPVGATNTFGTDARNDDAIATYSSRGPTRSFWTDEANVKHFDHLIKPDLVAPGNLLIGAKSKDNQIAGNNQNLEVNNNADDRRKVMYLSGTSMATPIVSGAVALMLQTNPKLTPNLVKTVLQYTAQPLAGFNTLEQGAEELNVEGAIRLTRLIRQNLPVPQGTSLLTTTTLPVHTSKIAGTKFQWTGGIYPNYGALTGTNLITKYQKIYDNGMIFNDGLLVSDSTMSQTGGVLVNGDNTSRMR